MRKRGRRSSPQAGQGTQGRGGSRPHRGGRVRIEKTLPPKPADHAAASRGRGDGGVACSSQRRRSSPSNFSTSSRKILITAATALGRSPRTPRSRLGREMTRYRTGTGGMT